MRHDGVVLLYVTHRLASQPGSTEDERLRSLASPASSMLLGMADVGELQAFKAEFFKALAHPLRIRILECLATGPRSVQELQEALSADQPTVSQQLAVLRTKNVVVTRKQGTVVNYDLRDPAIRELLEVARRLFNNQLNGTQSMLKALRREGRSR